MPARAADLRQDGSLPAWLPGAGVAAWLAFAGFLVGTGWRPGLGLVGWLGLAALAAGLRGRSHGRARAIGLTAFVVLADQWGHPWHLEFVGAYLPGGVMAFPAAVAAMAVVWLGPPIAMLWGAWALAARRGWAPWAWLPAAWWLWEAAHSGISGIDHVNWLYSQWQAAWVLRGVASWGWTPTLLAAVTLCAAAGTLLGGAFDALRARRHRLGAPEWVAAGLVAAGVAAFAALPAIAPAGPAAFAGIGAVHLPAPGQARPAPPPGTRLLVWPELTLAEGPRMDEGDPPGALVEPPVRAAGLHHLLGAEARGRGGALNAVLAVDPQGRVGGLRAKSGLFPLGEAPFWGRQLPGCAPFVRGTAPPVLDVAGRRVGVLICLEAMNRPLAAAARAAGATLLVVPTIEADGARSELGQVNLLATCVMRAVETGLPVVRAAAGGRAAMIDRDGRILAASEAAGGGVLTVGGDRPTLAAPAPAAIAVLYSRHTPDLLPRLPRDAYRAYAIEGFADAGHRADTVVVSGDSVPPTWLGVPPAELARAVAGFRPRLVVLDTCFGATLQLLEALAASGVTATVVGPAYRIPAAGLRYEAGFLAAAPAAARAALVRTEPPFPLLRWAPVPDDLRRMRTEVAGWDADELRRRLKSVRPPLVRLSLPGRQGAEARVLAWVAPGRFGAGSRLGRPLAGRPNSVHNLPKRLRTDLPRSS